MNYDNVFVLDTEATSPSPMTGLMTEFGIVHLTSGLSLYAKLYDFTPHPDIPALPVVTDPTPRISMRMEYEDAANTFDSATDTWSENPLKDAAALTRIWVTGIADSSRAVLVSDNNGFDAMWFTCFMDAQGEDNPFGFSSRRIGDFYAGTRNDWRKASEWKRLRRTKHTHNPVDDARGNAEALRVILGIPEPKGTP